MAKNLVLAKKGNREKQFTLKNWNDMPKDKYGWELIHKPTLEAPPEAKVQDAEKVSISSLPPKKVEEPTTEAQKEEKPKKGGRPAKK